ncbi:MotA/TolQ/ExbB proton channel family protein [Schlesneria sp. T3-172]|uniref:MotA/TolQ/ExbB proton channel family protein n=1 Tax=Schlesneria sphaerica TaxID=3373610 RepID=UPI0037CB8A56
MTDRLVEILYLLSEGLLAPTLILIVTFLAGNLLMLGGLLREFLDRAFGLRSWRSFLTQLRARKIAAASFYDLLLVGYPARYQRATQRLNHASQSVLVNKSLEDLELDITRRLARLGFSTRLGPMLGLIGTLIPLGPALTGLASGDIQALSSNLVIAFTTTVFGILIGGFSYAASVARKSWYEQDLSDLEFVATLLKSDSVSDSATVSVQDTCHAT